MPKAVLQSVAELQVHMLLAVSHLSGILHSTPVLHLELAAQKPLVQTLPSTQSL